MLLLHTVRAHLYEILDRPPNRNWSLMRRGNVVHLGDRSYCEATKFDGKPCIRKIYNRTHTAMHSLRTEQKMNLRFNGLDWHTPWLASGRTWYRQPWFIVERYDESSRLDRIAPTLNHADRLRLATQALHIVFDMHRVRVAHRDIHSKNLFVQNGRLKLIDFETAVEYPDGYNPHLLNCYDMTGQGLDSPFATANMGFLSANRYSLYNTLRLDDTMFRDALSALEEELGAPLICS